MLGFLYIKYCFKLEDDPYGLDYEQSSMWIGITMDIILSSLVNSYIHLDATYRSISYMLAVLIMGFTEFDKKIFHVFYNIATSEDLRTYKGYWRIFS